MLRQKIKSALNRRHTLKDLILGFYGNPKLFMKAVNSAALIRSRRLESGLRAKAIEASPKSGKKGPLTLEATLRELSEEFPVLFLGDAESRCQIGVADVDMLSCLVRLSARTHGFFMTIAGETVDFGDRNFNSRVLSAPFISVNFVTAPRAERVRLSIEPYFRMEPGRWVSNNNKNSNLRAVYIDIFETPGYYKATDILEGPTIEQRDAETPIDVVYTWVNHDDPEWAALYQKFKCGPQNPKPSEVATDAASMTRFRSNDELRYSLRSVSENLPWVRNIYILSNCAPPSWLDCTKRPIHWVDHKAVIAEKYLPTFSSHVIESCLHKIEGLSEKFIYLNDDVFIGRPLKTSFFFSPGGNAHSFLEEYGMVSGKQTPGDPDYLNASRNSAAILREAFGFSATRLHKHTGFSLKKSVLAEIEARWQERFDGFRKHRFRNIDDLNMVSFLFHHYALATRQAQVSRIQNAFVKSTDIRWLQKLNILKKSVNDVICINEGGTETPSADWQRQVVATLKGLFSQKASWEID